MTTTLQRIWFGLAIPVLVAAAVMIPVGLFAVAHAPIEALQGPPQKIFYLHVPLAFTSFILFGGVAINGIMYLIRKDPFWDWAGHGCASAGFLTLSGVLLTGPIWARPIWGVWWVWDPRLTTTFILWVMIAVYHLIRISRGNDGWTARASAILGIFAFTDVPIIHLSVLWWRSLHPFPVVMQKGDIGGGLAPSMRGAFVLMLIAVMLLGMGLASLRGWICKQEDEMVYDS